MNKRFLKHIIKEIIIQETTENPVGSGMLEFAQDLAEYKTKCKILLEETNEYLVRMKSFKTDKQDVIENIKFYENLLRDIKSSLQSICYPEGISENPSPLLGDNNENI